MVTVGLTVSFVAEFEPEPVLPAASTVDTVKVTDPSDSPDTSLLLKENALLAQVVVPEIEAGAVMVTVWPFSEQVPLKL